MKRILVGLLVLLMCGWLAQAQQAESTNTSGSVPSLINYGGVLKDDTGKLLTSISGVTFLIYTDEQGGSPVWMETQNVTPDRSGRYTVQLGATTASGLPADLFQTGEARWLAIQIAGEQEQQPRVLLVAVPYAMKAADAQTLGGLPASAFVLAAPNASASISDGTTSAANPSAEAPAGTNTSADVTTTGGTIGTISLFKTGTSIQNSLLTQTSTTAINVKGALVSPALGTATSSAGFNSQPQNFVASSFNSSTSAAENQTFQWQAQPAANDTASPSGTLNLLYGLGATSPTQTGLSIASDGQITFATGQTFPGTGTGNGTITGVTGGTGLSGSGTSGTVTLNNTGILALTAGTGLSSSGGQSPTLNNTGILALTAGTGMSSTGGQSPTLSINTSIVPELSAANTFTKNLSTSGELAAGGTASGDIANGTVEVDAGGTNKGTYSPGLNFGGGGQSIASDRAGTANVKGIDFYTNFTNRMSLTNGGNFGIGTTAPSHLFEVDGPSSQLALYNTNSETAVSVNNTGSGGHEYLLDSGGSGSQFVGSGNFGVYDATVGATRFVINSNGDVGIGVTTPTSPLAVNGTIYANNGGDAAFLVSTSSGSGVYAEADQDNNFSSAVFAQEVGTAQYDIGVWGYAASVVGIGSYSEAVSASVEGSEGIGFGAVGSWSDTGATDGIGALATADGGEALEAANNSSNSATAYFINASNASGAVILQTLGPTFGSCVIDTDGDFYCNGTISDTAPVGNAGKRVALYGVAAAENWFEDAGSGQLVNGVAVVSFDPEFVQTVNTKVDYKVFPVPNGDCKGLYVTSKTATSFEVRELGGGTSNVAFDYRIMAKRAGFETVRLEDKTPNPAAMERLKRRPAGTHGPNPDDVRKAHMAKMAALRSPGANAAVKPTAR